MKNLIEISRIVTKKKVKKIEIFDEYNLKNKSSKFNEFYDALMAGRFKNDRDAATALYQCSPTDDKYRQLKSRFRKRLLNTLFFLDVNLPSTSSYDRAYYSCNKDWTLVKILDANNAPQTATALAKHILSVALKYHFADIIVNCARILRRYSITDGEAEAFEEYDGYCKQYQDILNAEIRSEELFQRVTMNYGKTVTKGFSLEDNIDAYCDALISLSEMYESPVIIYNMYLVWTYRYEMTRDYTSMLDVCERAEKYIETNPIFYQDGKAATFQLKKMSAYLHLKDFKNGRVAAEKCLQVFAQGSDTWFDFMEYYMLLALHTDNYINALAILKKAKSHPRFIKLQGLMFDKWQTFELYLNFVVESFADTNPVYRAHRSRTFRLSKFLSDPISFPKEYRILTIHHLIAQVLFLVDAHQFMEANERIDRLKNYANRSLRKDEDFRVIQFIRLLQQLSKAEYRVSELSNTEKYLARMEDTPMSYRGEVSEIEFVPYESLWELLMNNLRK